MVSTAAGFVGEAAVFDCANALAANARAVRVRVRRDFFMMTAFTELLLSRKWT
jgi:hypothetical protein